jgi:hypothetical protein
MTIDIYHLWTHPSSYSGATPCSACTVNVSCSSDLNNWSVDSCQSPGGGGACCGKAQHPPIVIHTCCKRQSCSKQAYRNVGRLHQYFSTHGAALPASRAAPSGQQCAVRTASHAQAVQVDIFALYQCTRPWSTLLTCQMQAQQSLASNDVVDPAAYHQHTTPTRRTCHTLCCAVLHTGRSHQGSRA